MEDRAAALTTTGTRPGASAARWRGAWALRWRGAWPARWREALRVGLAWPIESAWRHGAAALGVQRFARSPDRRLLEDVILAHYAARARPQRLLFVGTRGYTRGVERLLDGHILLTLDIDPRAARHGSTQGHVTACASRAAECFDAASFDVVVFNGVFGWGLDRRPDVERAVDAFATLLVPGGELIVGWNNVAPRRPFAFGELQALAAFERFAFEPFGQAVVELDGPSRHRFEFFRRHRATTPDMRSGVKSQTGQSVRPCP